jgi:hypothetical protein
LAGYPLEKIDRACNIKVFVEPKLKFLIQFIESQKRFEGDEVTILAANFDKYKYILDDLVLQRKVCGKFDTIINFFLACPKIFQT